MNPHSYYNNLCDATSTTFPSIIATQELVVPKSIPITSLPAGFELENQTRLFRKSQTNKKNQQQNAVGWFEWFYLNSLATLAHFWWKGDAAHDAFELPKTCITQTMRKTTLKNNISVMIQLLSGSVDYMQVILEAGKREHDVNNAVLRWYSMV